MAKAFVVEVTHDDNKYPHPVKRYDIQCGGPATAMSRAVKQYKKEFLKGVRYEWISAKVLKPVKL